MREIVGRLALLSSLLLCATACDIANHAAVPGRPENPGRLLVVSPGIEALMPGRFFDYVSEARCRISEGPQELEAQRPVWRASQAIYPNPGLSSHTYWFRLRLESAAVQKRVLYMPHSFDELRVYLFRGDVLDGTTAATGSPVRARMLAMCETGRGAGTLQNRRPACHLELPAGRASIYIRMSNEDSLWLPAQLLSDEAYQRRQEIENLLYGAYFGVLWIMALYNLLVYLRTRESSFLVYVAFTVANIAHFFVQSGFAAYFLLSGACDSARLHRPDHGGDLWRDRLQLRRQFPETPNPFAAHIPCPAGRSKSAGRALVAGRVAPVAARLLRDAYARQSRLRHLFRTAADRPAQYARRVRSGPHLRRCGSRFFYGRGALYRADLRMGPGELDYDVCFPGRLAHAGGALFPGPRGPHLGFAARRRPQPGRTGKCAPRYRAFGGTLSPTGRRFARSNLRAGRARLRASGERGHLTAAGNAPEVRDRSAAGRAVVFAAGSGGFRAVIRKPCWRRSCRNSSRAARRAVHCAWPIAWGNPSRWI